MDRDSRARVKEAQRARDRHDIVSGKKDIREAFDLEYFKK